MQTITLHGKYGEGKFALVDDIDHERVDQHRWLGSADGYAFTCTHHHATMMHNFIAQPPNGKQWDHKNRNRLDNQRSNLRPATAQQNTWNSSCRKGEFKGVSWSKIRNGFVVFIQAGKDHYLGIFDSAEDGAYVYDSAARKFYGEFAATNFPEDPERLQLAIAAQEARRFRAQNNKHRKGTSEFRGVSWSSQSKKWVASIRVHYRSYHLGYFTSEELAHQAYLNARKRFGR